MKITERIHAIKIPFQIKLPAGPILDRFVYAYLIYGNKIYLIDSGVASAEGIILDYIAKTRRKQKDISLIILTHSHPDHIGAAKGIKEKSGCRIAAHHAEKKWIEDVGLQSKERPVPGFGSLVKGSVRVDRILDERDILKLENNISLEVLHTPGHSRGSISFLFHEEMALFSGDAVFLPGDIPIYEDVTAAINSMKRLKEIKDISFLFSSWADPVEGDRIYQLIDRGLHYLQDIHNLIVRITGKEPINDPMRLCKKVVTELKLPASAVNPLVARSFQSNLKLINNKNLPEGRKI